MLSAEELDMVIAKTKKEVLEELRDKLRVEVVVPYSGDGYIIRLKFDGEVWSEDFI